MPVIHTQPGSVVFSAGKGLGAIQAEREAYTRGVEQARLDIQKKQIADNQMMRKLARIDAEEKETRRQLEWEAIQKRQAEQFKTTQEGVESRFERSREITPQQQLLEDRYQAEKKRELDTQKRNEDMLRRISQGETAPTVTQPTELPPNWESEREAFRKKYPSATMTKETPAPTPIQISEQEEYFEGLKKSIKPIDKAKLRKTAAGAYNSKLNPAVNEVNIQAKYNELLETANDERQAAQNAYNREKLRLKWQKDKAKKELAEAQKAAQKAGETRKFNLAKTILSKGDEDITYSEKDRQWAKTIIAKYTSGVGTGGATTDILGIR